MPRITTTTAGTSNLDATISSRAAKADGWNAANGALASNLVNLDIATSALARVATYFSTFYAIVSAGAVSLDTGALAAGEYEVLVFCMNAGTGAGGNDNEEFQFRNAANTASNKALYIGGESGTAGMRSASLHWPRVTVAVNERFRIINTNGGSGSGAPLSMYLFVRLAV